LDGDALDTAVSRKQFKAYRHNRSSQIFTNMHIEEVARVRDGRQTVTPLECPLPQYFDENKFATTINYITQCDVLCHESQDSTIYEEEIEPDEESASAIPPAMLFSP